MFVLAPALDLVGVGLPFTDVLLRLPHLPATDETLPILQRDVQGGGNVPTACCAAARLGLRVAFIGATGAAPLPDLADFGVDAEGVRVQPGRRGPVSFILIEAASGARSILWDAGDLDPLELTAEDFDRIAGARYLIVCEPFAAAVAAARHARSHDVPVVWDAEVRGPASEALMPLVDHCIASRTFADTLGEPVAALAHMPAPVAVVTLGSEGVVGRTPAGPFRLPAYPVNVADTTGAGDVFHGAYIAELCRGRDPMAAARYASAAAALKCRSLGARPGIPTDGEVRALMQTHN